MSRSCEHRAALAATQSHHHVQPVPVCVQCLVTLHDAYRAVGGRHSRTSSNPSINEQRLRIVTTPLLGEIALGGIPIASHAFEGDGTQRARVARDKLARVAGVTGIHNLESIDLGAVFALEKRQRHVQPARNDWRTMSPSGESAIDSDANRSRNSSEHNWHTVAMTLDPRTLNSVQESHKPNFTVTCNAMRTQYATFNTFSSTDLRFFTVRTAVTLIGRRVSLNYLDIREKRLDRA